MNQDTVFDLPELASTIAHHLPQQALYHCVQVSKSWHATFIHLLWKSFSKDPCTYTSSWSRGLTNAFHQRDTNPQELEWFNDVYRRHAKYIRHLTLHMLPILHACLEDAFEPLLPVPLENDPKKLSESGALTTAAVLVVGRSLMTNLESLSIRVFGQALDLYFTDLTPNYWTRSLFSTDFNVNNANNASNDDDDEAMPRIVTESNQRSSQTMLIEACQRLIVCNPRLGVLECEYVPQILHGLQAMLSETAAISGDSDGGCRGAVESLGHSRVSPSWPVLVVSRRHYHRA
ncbi:hypothetical protein BGZ96_004042 [Linnemannia gamsii]|uniref:F-box domain-containing protein n=1 Tax=Linnemannia gamsii TaxID=64522 RepID=A0ABQ7K659_9FUNG|nr:hypothetical protein BGZ96_004042 [Linnemannia gamsii]